MKEEWKKNEGRVDEKRRGYKRKRMKRIKR
jgi:hypothetical protein